MGIKQNPHGVGYSGQQAAMKKSICPCCGAEYAWRAGPQMVVMKPPCVDCEKHDLSTPNGELVALREHHGRLPRLLVKARQITREAKQAEERAKNEVVTRRQQVAAALSSRDRYKEIVEEVELDPHCYAGPTIARLRAEQRKREGEAYMAYLDHI